MVAAGQEGHSESERPPVLPVPEGGSTGGVAAVATVACAAAVAGVAALLPTVAVALLPAVAMAVALLPAVAVALLLAVAVVVLLSCKQPAVIAPSGHGWAGRWAGGCAWRCMAHSA